MPLSALVDPNGQPVELAQAATLVRRVTLSTAAVLTDSPVDFNTGFNNKIGTIVAVTVALSSGAGTRSMKFGTPTEQAIPLILGEVRNGLSVPYLFFTTDGLGGSITLEIHGRP